MRGELLSVRGAIVEAHTRGVGHADLRPLNASGELLISVIPLGL